jgi:hypothetical protein
MNEVSRRLADLYGHLLLEARSGPYSFRIAEELGPGTPPVWLALLERQNSRLRDGHDPVPIDGIDWAAIRVIAPAMLRRYDDATLYSTTGYRLPDLAELERLAVSMRREYRTPRHAIAYQIGDCVVEFPAMYVARGVMLAAVPDEPSWDRVVPECARGRREEFLEPLRRAFQGSRTVDRGWAERRVSSIDELREWIEARAAPFRDERARRLNRRPLEP